MHGRLWHSLLHAREHFGAVEAIYVLVTAGILLRMATAGARREAAQAGLGDRRARHSPRFACRRFSLASLVG